MLRVSGQAARKIIYRMGGAPPASLASCILYQADNTVQCGGAAPYRVRAGRKEASSRKSGKRHFEIFWRGRADSAGARVREEDHPLEMLGSPQTGPASLVKVPLLEYQPLTPSDCPPKNHEKNASSWRL